MRMRTAQTLQPSRLRNRFLSPFLKGKYAMSNLRRICYVLFALTVTASAGYAQSNPCGGKKAANPCNPCGGKRAGSG